MSRAWLLHKWTDRVLLTDSLWVPASPQLVSLQEKTAKHVLSFKSPGGSVRVQSKHMLPWGTELNASY